MYKSHFQISTSNLYQQPSLWPEELEDAVLLFQLDQKLLAFWSLAGTLYLEGSSN